MKILWLTNVPLPEASFLMNIPPSVFGGWLVTAANDLSMNGNVQLSIAFPSKDVNNKEECLQGERISFWPFNIKRPSLMTEFFKELLLKINPDIVHIHGTEMSHTRAMVTACNHLRVRSVISIQGLVSIIEKHMYAGLPFHAIYGQTLRNVIRKDSVYSMKARFRKKGHEEILSIRNVDNVIGRTTWDRACVMRINPKIRYFHCNETLRSSFYGKKWSLEKAEKFSIFASQGHYPIKGLHYLLEAMPMILEKYPQAKLYISGRDVTKSDTVKDRLLLTNYGKYIKRLVERVEGDIVFTGPLDEERMCERYLSSHVFVCPSSIENSPNSLGEAMLLGVPCVASYVGGIPDMLKSEEEGFLYQHDAPYMLAHCIGRIFGSDDLARIFSQNASERARKTHDRQANTARLMQIYDEILMTKTSI